MNKAKEKLMRSLGCDEATITPAFLSEMVEDYKESEAIDISDNGEKAEIEYIRNLTPVFIRETVSKYKKNEADDIDAMGENAQIEYILKARKKCGDGEYVTILFGDE